MNRFRHFSVFVASITTALYSLLAVVYVFQIFGLPHGTLSTYVFEPISRFINNNSIQLTGAIYLLLAIAMIVAVIIPDQLGRIVDKRALFGWDELKELSQTQFFKLSYISLVAIPILVYAINLGFLIHNAQLARQAITSIVPPATALPASLTGFHWTVPLNLKLSYFSAFSFAVALIILAICCPKEIKTDSAPASTAISPPPINLARTNPAMRALCTACHVIGIILLVIVLLNSAVYIYYA